MSVLRLFLFTSLLVTVVLGRRPFELVDGRNNEAKLRGSFNTTDVSTMGNVTRQSRVEFDCMFRYGVKIDRVKVCSTRRNRVESLFGFFAHGKICHENTTLLYAQLLGFGQEFIDAEKDSLFWAYPRDELEYLSECTTILEATRFVEAWNFKDVRFCGVLTFWGKDAWTNHNDTHLEDPDVIVAKFNVGIKDLPDDLLQNYVLGKNEFGYVTVDKIFATCVSD